jgi:hypothetical protein
MREDIKNYLLSKMLYNLDEDDYIYQMYKKYYTYTDTDDNRKRKKLTRKQRLDKIL